MRPYDFSKSSRNSDYKVSKMTSVANVFLLRTLGIALSFVLHIYLVNTLEKELVGEYFYFIQLLMLVSMVCRYGSDTALLRFSFLASSKDKSDLFRLSAKIFFFFLLCLCCAYLVITIWYSPQIQDAQAFDSTLLLASLVLFSFINYAAEFLRGKELHNRANLVQFIMIPLLIIFFSYVFALPLSESYFWSITVTFCIASLLYNSAPSYEDGNTDVLSRYRSSMNLFFVVSILNAAMSSVDTILLGELSNTSVVAEYNIGARLAGLLAIFLLVVNGIVAPMFSKYWESKNINALVGKFRFITKWLCFFAIACVLISFLVGEQVIRLFFGEEYIASFQIFMVIICAHAFALATGPSGYLLMMSDNGALHRKALIFAVLLNLALNICLIPTYGGLGAAIATAISIFFKNLLGAYFANRLFGVYFETKAGT